MVVKFIDARTRRKLAEVGDLYFGADVPQEGELVQLADAGGVVVDRRWKQGKDERWTVEVRLRVA